MIRATTSHHHNGTEKGQGLEYWVFEYTTLMIDSEGYQNGSDHRTNTGDMFIIQGRGVLQVGGAFEWLTLDFRLFVCLFIFRCVW